MELMGCGMRNKDSVRCRALAKALPLDGQRMNHSRLEQSMEGKRERCRDVFVPRLTSALAFPLSTLSLSPSLSPFSSPGRLSNQEEMLGLSQCRPEDQMCGLEVVRQRRNGNQI